jgi:clan AA aspartic protease
LTVIGPRGESSEIEAVVDTGFTSYLTLPPEVISTLGLTWKNQGRGILADGSECLFDVYWGRVIWDGKTRWIYIGQSDSDPLIGMSLLEGFELAIQVREGGAVTIRPLPDPA